MGPPVSHMQTLPLNGKPAPLTLELRLIKRDRPPTGTTYSVSRPGSPGHRSWKLENFQGKELFGFQTSALCAGRTVLRRQEGNLTGLLKCAGPTHSTSANPFLNLVVGTFILNNQAKTATLAIKQGKTGKLQTNFFSFEMFSGVPSYPNSYINRKISHEALHRLFAQNWDERALTDLKLAVSSLGQEDARVHHACLQTAPSGNHTESSQERQHFVFKRHSCIEFLFFHGYAFREHILQIQSK